MYDYLIVGSGLFGATFAYEAGKRGKSCLVVEKRPHIGGNIYTEEVEGIQVHRYGAHIFNTSNRKVWDYVQQFAEFNRYTNCPVAYYKGEIYNMPFNMNTFHKMWGVVTPQEAKEKIASQIRECGVENPGNLEDVYKRQEQIRKADTVFMYDVPSQRRLKIMRLCYQYKVRCV